MKRNINKKDSKEKTTNKYHVLALTIYSICFLTIITKKIIINDLMRF